MEVKPLHSKAFVRVVPVKRGSRLPVEFPWISYVAIALHGDLSKLDVIQKEMDEIKSIVNRDISKFKLNLKDYKIEIAWKV